MKEIFDWKKNPENIFFFAMPLFLIAMSLNVIYVTLKVAQDGEWIYAVILLIGILVLVIALYPIWRIYWKRSYNWKCIIKDGRSKEMVQEFIVKADAEHKADAKATELWMDHSDFNDLIFDVEVECINPPRKYKINKIWNRYIASTWRYVYRNLPVNCCDHPWYISGTDNGCCGGCGVLEWCLSKEDAKVLIKKMRRNLFRFKKLKINKPDQ